mmetsp:Transcript_53501/g.148319  ORF Transcript_53501/g.148319 Transcript_53501/m.148319 type:complete len:287 (+) Transcript_53501:313-1173(+)
MDRALRRVVPGARPVHKQPPFTEREAKLRRHPAGFALRLAGLPGHAQVRQRLLVSLPREVLQLHLAQAEVGPPGQRGQLLEVRDGPADARLLPQAVLQRDDRNTLTERGRHQVLAAAGGCQRPCMPRLPLPVVRVCLADALVRALRQQLHPVQDTNFPAHLSLVLPMLLEHARGKRDVSPEHCCHQVRTANAKHPHHGLPCSVVQECLAEAHVRPLRKQLHRVHRLNLLAHQSLSQVVLPERVQGLTILIHHTQKVKAPHAIPEQVGGSSEVEVVAANTPEAVAPI